MNNFLKTRPYILIGILVLLYTAPAARAGELILPVPEFSTNYYDAYGEPDIYASVVGDVELERGEGYMLNVILSNRGVLHGVKYDSHVDTDETIHALSIQELEYEAYRTTALGIKAELISTTDYIEIDPGTSLQTLEELAPGSLPDSPFIFTLSVSEYAPAGEYILLLPLEYQYQNEVEMTGGSTVILGLPSLDHTTYYRSANKTLEVPVYVKPEPRFEIVSERGGLEAGSTAVVNVTYANKGEMPANDAVARIVAMKPLSTSRNEISLGTMNPGDTKTVSFEISAESDAVVKDYAISSEIKYTDEENKTGFSDALLVHIPLRESETLIPTTYLLLGCVTLVVIFMLAGYAKKR
jgi:hypothetical protein